MSLELVAIKATLSVIMLMGVLTLAGLLTWVERKQSAVMQDRIGANRASIFGIRILGLFHPLADILKLLTKEDFIPKGADRALYVLAPFLSVFFAIPAFAAIPFGDALRIGERVILLQVADIPVGLLYIFALMSMGVYGVVLAGISSNNNYSFLGGLRASSQMISYEVTMGVAVVGIVMVYESMSLQEIVRAQGDYLWGFVPKWGFVVQPLAALLFFVAAMAETKRVPFDLPEGESEIIGYFVEYSGMKFGLFYLTDFIETTLLACMMTTLFFGGWQIPYLYPGGFHFPWGLSFSLPHLGVIFLGVAAFTVKVMFFCWLLMTVRWTLPRFRYDQLMRLGWKIILPLSLANIVVTGIFLLV
ncbi:MAG: NADH-quinone oxidoreductase subunit NuoH [Candidatus Omnitrophota bacterium]